MVPNKVFSHNGPRGNIEQTMLNLLSVARCSVTQEELRRVCVPKNYYYYIRLTGFCRTTWVSRRQKGKPFWILLEQEMMGTGW